MTECNAVRCEGCGALFVPGSKEAQEHDDAACLAKHRVTLALPKYDPATITGEEFVAALEFLREQFQGGAAVGALGVALLYRLDHIEAQLWALGKEDSE